MYIWVCFQIVFFYASLAYGVHRFSSYLCFEADREELELQDEFRSFMRFREDHQAPVMVGLENDKREPLLPAEVRQASNITANLRSRE
jgi:hypothetical protein